MRAVLLPGDRRVEIVEKPVPEPGPGQVVLRMAAAGLCGSDLHMQYHPTAAERHGVFYGLQTNPDIVVGHEPAGVVAEVGEGVGELREGDRVAVHHMAGCGHCDPCRRGWDINCANQWGIYGTNRDGAMSDYMLVRARDCVKVPDSVSLSEACYYSCGAGTGYLALERGSFGLGDVVAVVGLGPVGLAAGYFAAQAGAQVIGFDTIDERLAFARDVGGVQHVLNPRSVEGREAVLEVTKGRGADLIVEATGRTSGRELAFSVTGLHARVVCVGFSDEVSPLHLQRDVLQRQVDVRGAWMFPIHALDRMMRSVHAQGISIESLITGRFPLEKSAEAWAGFDHGALGKTVIEW